MLRSSSQDVPESWRENLEGDIIGGEGWRTRRSVPSQSEGRKEGRKEPLT